MSITKEEQDKDDSSFLLPGSINASVLNLIAATLGAGTITMPYIICVAGVGLGTLLTILGAGLSHYTGDLLVSSINKHTDNLTYICFYFRLNAPS